MSGRRPRDGNSPLEKVLIAVRATWHHLDHFQDAGTAEALEHLCRVVLAAALGDVQGVTEELPHVHERAVGSLVIEMAAGENKCLV